MTQVAYYILYLIDRQASTTSFVPTTGLIAASHQVPVGIRATVGWYPRMFVSTPRIFFFSSEKYIIWPLFFNSASLINKTCFICFLGHYANVSSSFILCLRILPIYFLVCDSSCPARVLCMCSYYFLDMHACMYVYVHYIFVCVRASVYVYFVPPFISYLVIPYVLYTCLLCMCVYCVFCTCMYKCM